MNRPAAFLLIGAAVLASGCASVPMASHEADAAAKKFEVPSGRANLYVYRNESFGGAVRMSVQFDGAVLGDTAANVYLYTPIAPGPHTIVSKSEDDSQLTIEAKAGANYFLWQEVKMGLWAARSALQQVDDAKGRAGVAECNLAKTNAPLVSSGCTKDIECKGSRICKAGACIDSVQSLPTN
ncbi:MAG: DUF2846 domain-containing protein [Deltaproteobacteria bacterium]|nr:MAG: DUF2846 domain-containing protein [Deltaproteobacteria bacterium]